MRWRTLGPLLICSLQVLGQTSPCRSAEKSALPDLEIRMTVEPTQARFEPGKDVAIQVRIENSTAPCRKVVLDKEFVRVPSGRRPFFLLSLELTRSDGTKAERIGKPIAQYGPLRPMDLVELQCGESFGRTIVLTGIGATEWEFRLPAGRYSAHARVRHDMALFAAKEAVLLEQVLAAWQLPSPRRPLELFDLDLQATSTWFEVRGSESAGNATSKTE